MIVVYASRLVLTICAIGQSSMVILAFGRRNQSQERLWATLWSHDVRPKQFFLVVTYFAEKICDLKQLYSGCYYSSPENCDLKQLYSGCYVLCRKSFWLLPRVWCCLEWPWKAGNRLGAGIGESNYLQSTDCSSYLQSTRCSATLTLTLNPTWQERGAEWDQVRAAGPG